MLDAGLSSLRLTVDVGFTSRVDMDCKWDNGDYCSNPVNDFFSVIGAQPQVTVKTR